MPAPLMDAVSDTISSQLRGASLHNFGFCGYHPAQPISALLKVEPSRRREPHFFIVRVWSGVANMPLEYRNYRDFPLRLSPHMVSEATLLAERQGITLDAFIVNAVDEKVARSREQSADQASTGSSAATEA